MSTSNQTVSEHRQLMHELLGPVTMSLLGLAVALLVTAHFPTIVFGWLLESKAMRELAYVNLLRQKVRFLKADEKRSAAFDKSSSERFVPWVMPVQPPSQAAPEAKLTE